MDSSHLGLDQITPPNHVLESEIDESMRHDDSELKRSSKKTIVLGGKGPIHAIKMGAMQPNRRQSDSFSKDHPQQYKVLSGFWKNDVPNLDDDSIAGYEMASDLSLTPEAKKTILPVESSPFTGPVADSSLSITELELDAEKDTSLRRELERSDMNLMHREAELEKVNLENKNLMEDNATLKTMLEFVTKAEKAQIDLVSIMELKLQESAGGHTEEEFFELKERVRELEVEKDVAATDSEEIISGLEGEKERLEKAVDDLKAGMCDMTERNKILEVSEMQIGQKFAAVELERQKMEDEIRLELSAAKSVNEKLESNLKNAASSIEEVLEDFVKRGEELKREQTLKSNLMVQIEDQNNTIRHLESGNESEVSRKLGESDERCRLKAVELELTKKNNDVEMAKMMDKVRKSDAEMELLRVQYLVSKKKNDVELDFILKAKDGELRDLTDKLEASLKQVKDLKFELIQRPNIPIDESDISGLIVNAEASLFNFEVSPNPLETLEQLLLDYGCQVALLESDLNEIKTEKMNLRHELDMRKHFDKEVDRWNDQIRLECSIAKEALARTNQVLDEEIERSRRIRKKVALEDISINQSILSTKETHKEVIKEVIKESSWSNLWRISAIILAFTYIPSTMQIFLRPERMVVI